MCVFIFYFLGGAIFHDNEELTVIFRIYKDALTKVRVPMISGGSNGPMIELVIASLLHPNWSYTPLSTEFLVIQVLSVWLLRKCRKTRGI